MGKRAKQSNPKQSHRRQSNPKRSNPKRSNPKQNHRRQSNPRRSNPLGPRASRVQKARASKARLPAWYFRVLRLRWNQESFTKTDPTDFDEDLSEDSKEDCECDGEDSECDCQFQYDYDSEDVESERSYAGSDADYYYELKEEREERKKERWVERLCKNRQFKLERSMEEEVQAAERSLREVQKKRKTFYANPRSLAGQQFQLYCSDHVDHFYYSGMYEGKFVHFHHPDDRPVDDDSNDPDVKSRDDAGLLYGTLFLDLNTTCRFGPFFPPSNATYTPVKVESCDGKYQLSLDFLGNGYLKLRVSRDMVFMSCDESPAVRPPDAPAPEVFEFVGIWHNPEKEKAEREKMETERKKEEMERKRLERQRRSPSPRESWFELNHPMGAYYNPRYAVDW